MWATHKISSYLFLSSDAENSSVLGPTLIHYVDLNSPIPAQSDYHLSINTKKYHLRINKVNRCLRCSHCVVCQSMNFHCSINTQSTLHINCLNIHNLSSYYLGIAGSIHYRLRGYDGYAIYLYPNNDTINSFKKYLEPEISSVC